MTTHIKTVDMAVGRWRGILVSLGVPAELLTGKAGPCPNCGGKDRFRFDNREGRGTFICNQCGAGDGMKLAMMWERKPFYEVAKRIDALIGNVAVESQLSAKMPADERRRRLKDLWARTAPVEPGDLVDRFLRSRKIVVSAYPDTLRFGRSIKDGEGGARPCMVALVGVYGAKKFCCAHRTYLRPDGRAKAEMAVPRRLMSGELPDGACVQLAPWTGDGPLGIAEGIETAMSASILFGIPVWAALSASMLRKWSPPVDCRKVVIFGDNDPNGTGQKAANDLADRLRRSFGLTVEVRIPDGLEKDWNDVLMAQSRHRTL